MNQLCECPPIATYRHIGNIWRLTSPVDILPVPTAASSCKSDYRTATIGKNAGQLNFDFLEPIALTHERYEVFQLEHNSDIVLLA